MGCLISCPRDPVLTCSCSMGSAPWKGDTLVAGYRTYIGGREVELDSQVNASQLPGLMGSSLASGGDISIDSSGIAEPPNQMDCSETRDTPPVAKFVAPTSFYGTPIKKKPKGPLYDESCPIFPF